MRWGSLSREAFSKKKSGIYPDALDSIATYREYRPGEIYLIPVRFSEIDVPPIKIDGTRTLDRMQYVDLFPAKSRAKGVKSLIDSIRAIFTSQDIEQNVLSSTHAAEEVGRADLETGVSPSIDIWIDPGNATSEQLADLYNAFSDFHRAYGGVGIVFRDDKTRVLIAEGEKA